MNIVFFGSFQHYSTLVLQSLINAPEIDIAAVVTTPPQPVGRKQIITKTPVHLLAEKNQIRVFTPNNLKLISPDLITNNQTPTSKQYSKKFGNWDLELGNSIKKSIDFFIVAGYGKILPKNWLEYPTKGALNLHFSLLPAYRGANPAEWAIMCGETTTGITLMQMNEGLDTGAIIAQAELPITDTDTRETLYQKLYELGAQKLPEWLINLPTLGQWRAQASYTGPYAALLKRDDGFLPWSTISKALQGLTPQVADFPSKHFQTAFLYLQNKSENFLLRLPRALAGYPSLWTIVPTTKGNKRMKIISFDRARESSPLQIGMVQIEGQQPAHFNQIKNQIH